MDRREAKQHVEYVVDDAGAARPLGADQHAIIRRKPQFKYRSVLVGWYNEFGGCTFVAVHSYLDVKMSNEECTELATDYLEEIGWDGFENGVRPPDYIIR